MRSKLALVDLKKDVAVSRVSLKAEIGGGSLWVQRLFVLLERLLSMGLPYRV